MYYHFSLLCTFRPFLSQTIENAGIQPLEACTQAAKSILSLAQSYDDLFTLRRVSGFMPYFITAAALFSLSMEDSGGAGAVDVYHRSGNDGVEENVGEMKDVEMEEAEMGEEEEELLVPRSATTATGGEGDASAPVSPSATSSVSQARVQVSVVAHARLLLAKMSITHPAATVARRMLEGNIEPGHEMVQPSWSLAGTGVG
jgi:hypothetical protein